jgi:hypothetical protein
MAKRNIDDAMQRFLDNGGRVTKVRPADQKAMDKASRGFYHRDKALAGSGNSKALLKRQAEKESSLIFSRTERWKTDD